MRACSDTRVEAFRLFAADAFFTSKQVLVSYDNTRRHLRNADLLIMGQAQVLILIIMFLPLRVAGCAVH